MATALKAAKRSRDATASRCQALNSELEALLAALNGVTGEAGKAATVLEADAVFVQVGLPNVLYQLATAVLKGHLPIPSFLATYLPISC